MKHRRYTFSEWIFGFCLTAAILFFAGWPLVAAFVLVVGVLAFLGSLIVLTLRGRTHDLGPVLRKMGAERFVREFRRLHTHGSEQSNHLIGRERIAEAAERILERPARNNVLLVGGPRVGKKAVLSAVAERIPAHRFFSLDLARLIGEVTGTPTEKEHYLRAICDELVRGGRTVLVLERADEYLFGSRIHELSHVFVPYLEEPRLSLVLILRPGVYGELARNEPLLSAFEILEVPEPSRAETQAIVAEHFRPLEVSGPVFTQGALEAILKAADELAVAVPYHERAIELAEEIVLSCPGLEERRRVAPPVTEEVVRIFLSRQPMRRTARPIRPLGVSERLSAAYREPTLAQGAYSEK